MSLAIDLPLDKSKSDAELVIGLVTPVGSDTKKLAEDVAATLTRFHYRSDIIKLSLELEKQNATTAQVGEFEDDRVFRLIDAGNAWCVKYDSQAGVAALAIKAILRLRAARNRAEGDLGDAVALSRKPARRHAYILHSLKRLDEVTLLRSIYGPQFVLIGGQGTYDERLRTLTSRLGAQGKDKGSASAVAESMIQRDGDETDPFGQRVNDTLPMSDIFATVGESLFIERAFGLLFGDPSKPPTAAEHAMYCATATEARSVSVSRRVGAALVGPPPRESLIATGHNGVLELEVEEVGREFDASERMKSELIEDVARSLRADLGFGDEIALEDTLRKTRLSSIIEFQPAVHAEAAVISDAARRGLSTEACTLFVTTFPCHLCFKSAMAAGIAEVRYILPYPKSQAALLYPHSASRLKPFEGIAPRAYLRMFGYRTPVVAEPGGHIRPFKKETADPILPHRRDFSAILDSEQQALAIIEKGPSNE